MFTQTVDHGERSMRGGSWLNSPTQVRAAGRSKNAEGERYLNMDVRFRIAS
jgi:formylglycine-generating enzyme required for sulfatase activity